MNTNQFRDISYQLDDHGIVTLTFNTPQRKNALSMLSFYEFYLAIEAFEADSSAYAMILTGATGEGDAPHKEAYSSGGYFSQDAYDGVPSEVLDAIDFKDIAQKRTTLKMVSCAKPIIAAINGLAIGGALTLTLAGADQIYMSEHAWLQLPFAKLGISPELGSSFLLPRLLGVHKAKEIMLFAERINAEQALSLNMVNRVVPHGDLMDFAHSQAMQLVPPNGAPLAISEIKKLISAPLLESISDALDRENVALQNLFTSHDFAEGMAARIERRAPKFVGK